MEKIENSIIFARLRSVDFLIESPHSMEVTSLRMVKISKMDDYKAYTRDIRFRLVPEIW